MSQNVELQLGIADATADLHYVIEICKADGLTVLPDDGSGTAGYAFGIRTTDWARARGLISASHRFRSGDLHVFLFDQAIPNGQQLSKAVQRGFLTWRGSLRRQETLIDRPAPDPEFDAFVEERIARCGNGL
jgi:hypothetical protein